MDLEEWEVLSDEGFLEIHDDGGGNRIFSRKYPPPVGDGAPPDDDLNNNYFICPSPKKASSSSANHQLVLPVPIQFDHDDDVVIGEVKSPSNRGGGTAMETAADVQEDEEEAAVSQVFFKKMKETHEFVDMKLDSPKSTTTTGGGGWGVLPQIETPMVQFDKETTTTTTVGGGEAGGKMEEEKKRRRVEEEEDDSSDVMNSNIWKWSLHGIGAICSFGVAAATICIIILGSNNSHHHRNEKIRFQIYADEKQQQRIKEVVVEQANSKLNEAILAVKGVPLSSRRAHFTCGGYYEGL